MITLPYPPSSNRYWRKYGDRIVKSNDARDYQYQAFLLASNAGANVIDGPVGIELKLYRPAKRGDLDNRIKVLLDALQSTLYHDDIQIKELHAYMHDDPKNPRVELRAWSLSDPQVD